MWQPRLVENPCVKLAFCIELRVPLCSIIQKVHRKSRVFWQHRICSSCNIRFHKTTTHPIMMNFNLESCKLHHSFAKTTIFGVDVYMHHFFYSLFSHNIHTMERFAMKSRIPLGTLWVLHIPSCPLRGEGFEAFFSNLSVVFTSFLQHFNDWCVIKANRKQNKRCTSSKCLTTSHPSHSN